MLNLTRDPDVNPSLLARAGWQIVMRSIPIENAEPDMAALATETERSQLARALLEEAPVTVLKVEQALTRLRRWLLLERRWRFFPMTVAALSAQARHNGGAWLLDAQERARLAAEPDAPIAGTYIVAQRASRQGMGRPGRHHRRRRTTIRSVALSAMDARHTARAEATRRSRTELDPGGPETMPRAPEILIAGCGTGREIAFHRVRHPDARITAIDISGESLRYAADRLARIGLGGAETMQYDLHDVAALGRRFDFISCIGVLHHLPDPKKAGRRWPAC
ncbi:MAG: class I SAM-dependent methyltransferase [Rhizomicrobium sp.]